MKALIWFMTFLLGTLINTAIGEALGFRAGSILLYGIECYFANKLCKMWEAGRQTEQAPIEEYRLPVAYSSLDDYLRDEMFIRVVNYVVDTGVAKASDLHTRLGIELGTCARVIDAMERLGIIGEFVADEPREILMNREQWDAMYANWRDQQNTDDNSQPQPEPDLANKEKTEELAITVEAPDAPIVRSAPVEAEITAPVGNARQIIFCRKCGTRLPQDSLFCGRCGTKVWKAEPCCPHCGGERVPGALFCRHCGNKL